MVRKVKDYSAGKIYVIRNHVNAMVYVGSTTQALSKRMAEHRNNLRYDNCQNYKIYQKMREIGIEKFYIELIELCPCNSNEQLLKREGEFIRQFDSFNNGYNSVVAGRTQDEWRADNPEKVREATAKYRTKNPEKVREATTKWCAENPEYMREYYEANKAVLAEQMREYQKTNKEILAEYRREWYEANREAIKAKARERYALKKAQSQQS